MYIVMQLVFVMLNNSYDVYVFDILLKILF